MADRNSERDRRVRQLMGNKNPGFDVLGQAQAEIQDAQSELYNHVALQNAQDQSRLRETETITQAAEGMMAMEGGDQLQVQAARMNPSTQAALGKFGVRPTQSQGTSRNVQAQRVVTKTGDTTNIRNENITNNRTEIKVTQPTIPMQQPQVIQARGGGNGDSTTKFRTWLSGMFARQQNEAEIQRKEYRKKEWALGRTTSRLMKKIGEATSNLGNRLDPKNMTSTLGGQLKWLLLIFGATMIGKVWKPAMQFLANLEGGFRAAFGLPMSEDLRGNATRGLSIVERLKEAIGVDSKENKTLIQGIGSVFMEGIDKLIDKLKFWFEDRATAMKEVEFPSMGKIDFGPMGAVLGPIGDIFGSAMEGVVNSLKGVGQYLGDLITVAFGGSKGKVKVEAMRMQRQANQMMTNTQGKQVSAGDSALATGKGRDYMRKSDFDTFGNLKGDASSTQAMSESLISLFNDKSGKGHTAEITSGVSQIFNAAKRQGSVVIDPELLLHLGLGQQDLATLQRNGALTQKAYRIIAVKPNEAQKTEMGAYDGHAGFLTGGVLGTGLGIWGGAKAGAALGSFFGPAGTAIGGVLGGGIGAALGGASGGLVGSGVGAGVDRLIRDWTSQGLYPTLVPANSKERSADGSRGIPKMMWVLDKRGADYVKSRITALGGMRKGEELDLTSQNFYNFIRKRGEVMARKNGVTLKGETMSTNKLQIYQAGKKAYEDEWYDRYESKEAGSYNNSHFRHWNSAYDSGANFISGAMSSAAAGLNWAGTAIQGKRIGRPEQNRRAAWLMKRAMEYGFTKEQAAGIAGNAMKESSFSTETAYNPNDAGQGPGGGLVGWLGDNCRQVLRYARDIYGCNVDPNNVRDIMKVPFEVQGDILLKQLNGELEYSYKGRGRNAGLAIKRTGNAADAAVAMERTFEVSADWNKERDRTRIQYAQGFSDLNLDSVSSVMATTPLINMSGGGGTQGSGGGVVWIGDSQTAAQGGLWPKLVGQGLGGNFTFFGRPSANATHYLGTASESKLGPPVTNSGVSTCKAMLDTILSSPPKYVIIALGHNGVSGYSTLVSRLSVAGIEVIGIKMWAIDGSRSGMATYTPEQMEKLYSGISLNSWVNLTGVNIPKVSDGVHASQEGCQVAAAETLRQIKGGSAQSSGGLFDGAREVIGDALIGLGNLIDPKSSKEDDAIKEPPMTPAQKKAIKALERYDAASGAARAEALLEGGAKADEYGIYIETGGGTRAYLKDGANALNGSLSADDVSFVAKRNPKTGKLEEVSDTEEMIARDSVQVSMNSVFSSYVGKGSAKDVMRSDGKMAQFYLGEFKDIDGFSDFAKKKLKGKIDFWIVPTKDGSRVAIIQIIKFATEYIGFDPTKSGLSDKDNQSIMYVGPIIYELGRQWIYSLKDKKRFSDWQPTALFEHVQLTPQAVIEKNKLLKYIAMGEIVQKGDGSFYAGETALSTNEIKDLEKYGIIKKDPWWKGGGRTVASGYNAAARGAKAIVDAGGGFKSKTLYSALGIDAKGKKKYFEDHKNDGTFVYRAGQIFGPGGTVWGTYTGEGENRKTKLLDETAFEETNRKLGKEGLAQNDRNSRYELENIALSASGALNYNSVADFVSKIKIPDINKEKGLAAKVQARLLKQAKGKHVSMVTGTGEVDGKTFSYFIYTDPTGKVLFHKVTKNQIEKFARSISSRLGPEFLRTLPNEIRAKDIDEIYRKVSDIAVNAEATLERGKEFLPGFKGDRSNFNDRWKYFSQRITSTSVDPTKNKTAVRRGAYDSLRPTYSELASYLIKKGVLVERIKSYGSSSFSKKGAIEVYYRDGSSEYLDLKHNGMWFPEAIPSSWWGDINKTISKNSGAAVHQKIVEAWDSKDNNYKANLDTLFDQGKKDGTLKFDKSGKFVVNNAGVVVGVSDGKGGMKKIEKSDMDKDEVYNKVSKDQAISYFEKNKAAKIAYLQRQYGVKIEKGGLWKYSADGKFKIKVNENVSLNDLARGYTEKLFDRENVMVFRDGRWANNKYSETQYTGGFGYAPSYSTTGSYLSQEQVTHQITDIIEGLGKIDDSVNLNAVYSQATSKNTGSQVDQGIIAARQLSAQIVQEKKALASSLNQEDLLRIIADKTLETGTLSADQIKAIMDGVSDRTKQASIEADRTIIETIGFADKKWEGRKVYTTAYGNYVIGDKGELLRTRRDENNQMHVSKWDQKTTATLDGKGGIIVNDGKHISTTAITHITTSPPYRGKATAAGQ